MSQIAWLKLFPCIRTLPCSVYAKSLYVYNSASLGRTLLAAIRHTGCQTRYVIISGTLLAVQAEIRAHKNAQEEEDHVTRRRSYRAKGTKFRM